jgi:hypothetical protein
MLRYLIVSVGSGLLFGAMDGLLNANPLAQTLYEVFKPMARKSLNMPAGLVIDLVYGFVLAGIFVLLYGSLPGEFIVKGLVFGLAVWFFRVVMQVATQWMMFAIPASTLIYTLAAGLVEMLVLGLFYGLTLRSSK